MYWLLLMLHKITSYAVANADVLVNGYILGVVDVVADGWIY